MSNLLRYVVQQPLKFQVCPIMCPRCEDGDDGDDGGDGDGDGDGE